MILLLGIVFGVILAAGVIVGSILVLLATGSIWMMGALYGCGVFGFALVGVGLAHYLDQR